MPSPSRAQVTRHGLDVMLRRIIAEMKLLTQDSNADIDYTSSRYVVMFSVGVPVCRACLHVGPVQCKSGTLVGCLPRFAVKGLCGINSCE